jgi:hypothetical protein
LIHPVQHEPHSASASLRLRSGINFSHCGHGGSGAAPPHTPQPGDTRSQLASRGFTSRGNPNKTVRLTCQSPNGRSAGRGRREAKNRARAATPVGLSAMTRVSLSPARLRSASVRRGRRGERYRMRFSEAQSTSVTDRTRSPSGQPSSVTDRTRSPSGKSPSVTDRTRSPSRTTAFGH